MTPLEASCGARIPVQQRRILMLACINNIAQMMQRRISSILFVEQFKSFINVKQQEASLYPRATGP